MTAITLNLLAEEQQAEQANARDPVKTALAIGLSLVSLAMILGTIFWSVASDRRIQAGILQDHWDRIVAAQQATGADSYEAVSAAAGEIYTLNRTRMLSAPQIALVKDMIPKSVQLSRVTMQIVTETLDQGPAAPDEPEKGSKVKRAAPRKAVERFALVMDGRAFSSRPEIEVDNFLNALRNYPAFRDQVKSIQLRSIARTEAANGDGASAGPFASFVIDCQYKEGDRDKR